MTGLAEKALAKFSLPTRRDEPFRYVRLAGLNLEQAPGKFEIVELSEEALLLPLEKAMVSFGQTARFERWLEGEKDPFALLNGGLSSEGLFLYIAPKKEERARIVHRGAGGMLLPRLHIHVGKHASLHLILDQEGEDTVNRFLDFTLEENARVFVHFNKLGERQLDSVRVSVKRDGFFKSVNTHKSTLFQRQDYRVSLEGENAHAELFGVSEGGESHTQVLVEHLAPNTHSSQNFKGIVEDRASFEGKIYVDRIAQQTEAYQLSRYILLSDKASANSKPNLEIFADDVKASHGATIGQINPEEIFYLQSRGIERERAKRMLVEGFVQEIYNEIS